VLGDLVASSLATFLALGLWAQLDWLGFTWEFVRARAEWFIYLPVAWLVLLVNMYDLRRAANLRQTFRGILLAAVAGAVLYTFIYFIPSEPGSLPRRGPLYFLALASGLTLAWRWLYIRVLSSPGFKRRALLVGAGESGRGLLAAISEHNPPPYHIVGLIDDDQSKLEHYAGEAKVLGDNSLLLQAVQEHAVSEIVVSIQGPMNGEMFQALLDAQERGVEITRMPVAYEELLGRVPIQHLESDWLMRSFVDEIRVGSVYLIVKRLIDVVGGLLGLLALGLLLPWIALALLIESGRPVFFRQARLGRGGRVFEALKVRTMTQDAEADGAAHWAQDQDPRTTTVGRILRRAHLDEFPQFWNVIRGDMSLVGPRPERPELVEELESVIPFYRARLLVKPGVTGWAQVNYGKGASVEGSAEKLEYDLYYIKHRGLLLDLWIVLRTIGQVAGLQGV
jgi:exopolysaccharide biosynthesis polyprenyl glycosylphosphotransferase